MDFTPSCLKMGKYMWTRSRLTKSIALERKVEIINGDNAMIVGGRFLGGGNPNEWDPRTEGFHLYKRRARQP